MSKIFVKITAEHNTDGQIGRILAEFAVSKCIYFAMKVVGS